jgi:hypothetical protein
MCRYSNITELRWSQLDRPSLFGTTLETDIVQSSDHNNFHLAMTLFLNQSHFNIKLLCADYFVIAV